MRASHPLYAVLAFGVLTSACGVSAQVSRAEPTIVTEPPVTAAALPTTIADPTTTVAETTTTTTTTILPIELPKPIGPPRDAAAHEQRYELGTIEIPKIGVNETFLEGIRLVTLNSGPGHWPGTALPGEVGNVVVAGHRTSHSKPFRHLDDLAPGDEVIFNMPNGTFVYNVVSTEIVTPDRIDIINQTSAKTATLFACHPPGSTKQRIVVHLQLAVG